LAAFVVCTAATALTDSAGAARIISAVGASGVVPISLALLGDLFEFRVRGQALGWLFGAMAGGMAVGSTAGALLEPVAGWKGLFLWRVGPRHDRLRPPYAQQAAARRAADW
jgi:MFS family permease